MKCDEIIEKIKQAVLAAFAELKQKLHDAEMAKDDAEAANTEYREDIRKLKDKIQMHDFFWEGCGFDKLGFKNAIAVRDYCDKLKAENERLNNLLNVWNTYKILGNTYKELNATKRALWLARAERAADRARIFYFSDLETKLDIEGFSYDPKKKKGCKKLTARLWRIIWLKVERKCRTKAEEYK